MPVRAARELDNFLIRDGLDASTIISDLDAFTNDLGRFRIGVAEYSEDLSRYPKGFRGKNTPAELIPVLRSNIKSQAERPKRDMEATASNIASSASLRQAIANTRLQRSVMVLALVTIAIALASLYVSAHP